MIMILSTRLAVGRKISSRVPSIVDCHVCKSPQDMPRQQFPWEGTACPCRLQGSGTSYVQRDSGSPSSHCSCGGREYVVCKLQSCTPANTNNYIFCMSFIQHEFYNHVLPPTWNSKLHKFVERTILKDSHNLLMYMLMTLDSIPRQA